MRRLLVLAVLVLAMTGCPQTPPAPLQVTTTQLAVAVIDVPYSQQLTATGGTVPYHWSVIAGGIPAGMTLTDNGFLSGTPTDTGDFNFTIKVIDSSN